MLSRLNARRVTTIGLLCLLPPGLFAAEAITARAAACSSECSGGYRRLGALRDFTLGNAWTIYANCAHPEMPRVAVADGGKTELPRSPVTISATRPEPVSSAGAAIASAHTFTDGRQPPAPALVVAAGAPVRLWKRDGVVAIDLPGTALEAGSAGTRIRVRVAPGGKILRGTVRGPASVELDTRVVPGFSGEGQ